MCRAVSKARGCVLSHMCPQDPVLAYILPEVTSMALRRGGFLAQGSRASRWWARELNRILHSPAQASSTDCTVLRGGHRFRGHRNVDATPPSPTTSWVTLGINSGAGFGKDERPCPGSVQQVLGSEQGPARLQDPVSLVQTHTVHKSHGSFS